MVSRLLSGVTLVALLMAMSVTGALWGFWRTLDGISDNYIPNPFEMLFGYWVDENGNTGFGYGYGYWYGDILAGTYSWEQANLDNSSSSSSWGGGWSSSGGGWGSSSWGGGWGSSSGWFNSVVTGSSSTSSGWDNPSNNVIVDIDKYIQQLQEIKDQLNASGETEQVPAPGLVLPSILPQTGTAASAKGIKTYTHPSVETAYPTWLQPSSLANASTDASYWINTIPYTQDRNANAYVVIPTTWVVAPINASSAEEAAKAISGSAFNYSIPLQSGVAHYPGTQKPGETGTSVIFGHSSDYKANPGRYKTIFWKIIELDLGEEIWIYAKNTDGAYERMRFVVDTSREISPSKTDVLLPKAGKNLTLLTCTPIGWISGRWHVNAKLVEANTSTFQYPNISLKHKFKINVAMNKYATSMSDKTDEERRMILATIAYRIEMLQTKYADNQYALDLLEYIKIKVAEML